MRGLEHILCEHKKWLNKEGGRCANLFGADLREADLRGANLDFSCLPLWCGSVGATIDGRLSRQFVYHAICNMPEGDRAAFLDNPIRYANGFHRVGEVPALKWGRYQND